MGCNASATASNTDEDSMTVALCTTHNRSTKNVAPRCPRLDSHQGLGEVRRPYDAGALTTVLWDARHLTAPKFYMKQV